MNVWFSFARKVLGRLANVPGQKVGIPGDRREPHRFYREGVNFLVDAAERNAQFFLSHFAFLVL